MDKRPRKPGQTSIVVRPEDRAVLDALGMSVTEAIREFCGQRAGHRVATPVAAVVLVTDPGATDPSDNQPDKPPANPHGWRNIGARLVARASSIAEIVALDAEVGGSARLGSPYVTLTAEVPCGR